jgi:glycerol-3-phosphate dehydrogenase
VIHDHGAAGGPQGLFSVSGVKFTTARLVAQKTLAKAFGRTLALRPDATRPEPVRELCGKSISDRSSPLDGPPERLRMLAEQESVQTLDDLLLRRMDSTLTARDPCAWARARQMLGWDDAQRVGTGVSPR